MWSLISINTLQLQQLDGKSLFRLAIDNSSYPESLLIKPGNHKINVRFMHGYAYSDGVLWLNAEEEKSYIIRKKSVQIFRIILD